MVDAATAGADPATLLAAAAGAYLQAEASDFGFRAEAIADEIATTRPALVGMQESTVWDAQPIDPGQPAQLLQVDFLAEIQKALADHGLHYEVVEQVEGFDAQLPLPIPGINANVRLTISDVLLRDASLPASDLRITGVMADHYTTQVPPLDLPDPLPDLPFPRQWIAADVVVRGVPARVITTHLESVSDVVATLQAQELLDGPAATDLPTVIMGDLNSTVDSPPTPVGPDAAPRLLAAGFDNLGPDRRDVLPGQRPAQRRQPPVQPHRPRARAGRGHRDRRRDHRRPAAAPRRGRPGAVRQRPRRASPPPWCCPAERDGYCCCCWTWASTAAARRMSTVTSRVWSALPPYTPRNGATSS